MMPMISRNTFLFFVCLSSRLWEWKKKSESEEEERKCSSVK
jgi:hypothetical protein